MAIIAKNGTFSLKRSTDSGSTYAVIPGVKSFDPGGIQTEQVDATDFDSTGNFREFISGYNDTSEGSFVLNFDPQSTEHTALRASQLAGTIEYFQAQYDDETITFTAIVTGFSNPARVGEILEATVTIKMTGEPTFAAVA